MVKKLFFLLFFLSTFFLNFAQKKQERAHCESKMFDKTIATMLSFSVPTIGVKELKSQQNNYAIFDAREKKEYEVSHIAGAKHIGYEQFNIGNLENISKNTPIVVYCSIGYRSEKIGEKLQKEGFTNVKNLYGSIFEWVNQGYPVVNNQNQPTNQVHTYNALWGNWVKNDKIQKVN